MPTTVLARRVMTQFVSADRTAARLRLGGRQAEAAAKCNRMKPLAAFAPPERLTTKNDWDGAEKTSQTLASVP